MVKRKERWEDIRHIYHLLVIRHSRNKVCHDFIGSVTCDECIAWWAVDVDDADTATCLWW
jgi:hypothetical protein